MPSRQRSGPICHTCTVSPDRPGVYRFLWIALLLASAGCAQLAPRPELPEDRALPPGDTTDLDRAMAPLEAAHPGQSGFRLMSDGSEAFAIFVQSAEAAGRSIDVQTYIWHSDLTGGYLAWKLLAAADRGVRVRLLVDDLDARGHNDGFAALHAHPSIEVRLFNPHAYRKGAIPLTLEWVNNFGRLTRRMHNKSWIVDNRIAVVGGRNLGNEYFDVSAEGNFIDLDFAMVGPVVRAASESFDAYWNSPLAYPMSALAPDGVSEAALAELRGRLAKWVSNARGSSYAELLADQEGARRLLGTGESLVWAADYAFIADDPLKASPAFEGGDESAVLNAMLPVMQATEERLTLVSPYFVPGRDGKDLLIGLVSEGREVRVLTNSLAANDVAAVHGGYTRYRKKLLKGGVQLWELKPEPGGTEKGLAGSSVASLHTKALVVDGTSVFVGSYNLDPRSTALNCEQVVFVSHPALAAEVEALFAIETGPERAWRITHGAGGLRWDDGIETHDSDPGATAGRRFQAWLAKVLRLDAQL
jgi:cardiolipin synthase C